MKKDCCGQIQHYQLQAAEDRKELARLRLLLQVLEDCLHRMGEYDRTVIETKMRLIEKTHGS